MGNYACAFSQSESGKYFGWIIRVLMPLLILLIDLNLGASLTWNTWEMVSKFLYWMNVGGAVLKRGVPAMT